MAYAADPDGRVPLGSRRPHNTDPPSRALHGNCGVFTPAAPRRFVASLKERIEAMERKREERRTRRIGGGAAAAAAAAAAEPSACAASHPVDCLEISSGRCAQQQELF